MKRKIDLLEKYLSALLVFVIPTQLAIHFWPQFSLLFGIRIDYLSPTIYLTDLLFITLFAYWVLRNRKIFVLDLLRRKWTILSLFLLMAFNIVFSMSPPVSLIKWLKIVEIILFSYYIYKRKDILDKNYVGKVLFVSLSLFSLIGIIHFLTGKTIGGPLYLLGERTFDKYTPAIALVNLFGNNFLRAYSTFPHPNSFAGFLGLFFVFFYLDNLKLNKVIKLFGLLVILIGFIFTFSLSSFIAIICCLVILLFLKEKTNILKYGGTVFFLLLLASLIFLTLSTSLTNLEVNLSKSFLERIELAKVSGRIISENIVFGAGLNTFILSMGNGLIFNQIVWLLQPVHNIFLLIMSETGIIGLVFVYLFFSYFIKKLERKNKSNTKWIFLSLVFVLLTGMMDHYWITIQQNILLLGLVIGISARDI